MGSTISAPKRPKQERLNTNISRFPTILHLYYAVGRALLRGDPRTRRPPLPLELVLLVFGSIRRRYSSAKFTAYSSGRLVFSPMAPPRGDTLYFHSAPLTRQFFNQVIEMRLTTESRVLGAFGFIYYNLESWTGFEIGILRRLGDDRKRDNSDIVNVKLKFHDGSTDSYTPVLKSDGTGDVLRWLSHRNLATSQPYISLSGEIFGPEHEIWEVLRESDVICVYACAPHRSTIMAKSGQLSMYEKFDPTGILQGIR